MQVASRSGHRQPMVWAQAESLPIKPAFAGKRNQPGPVAPEPGSRGFLKLPPRRRVLKVIAGTLLGSLGMLGLGKVLTPFELARPGQATENIGWNERVKVLASNGQNQVGYFDYFFNHYYTNELLDQLEKPGVRSLSEAHRRLVEKGYPAFPWFRKFPTETPREIGGWNKDETGKKRLVILWRQTEDEETHRERPFYAKWSDRTSREDMERMRQVFQREYRLADKDILMVPQMRIDVERDDVKESFDWLREKLRQNPGAEVLIYYVGHGFAFDNGDPAREGTASGYVNGLNEERLKRYVNRLQGAGSLYIMLDTCYSGAWIGY